MINQFTCAAFGANTGTDECSFDPGKILGFFLVGPSFAISEADTASDETLLAKLQLATLETLKANRLFPVHGLLDVADNSAEAAQQTFGYGAVVNTNNGTYNWSFPFIKGGICLLKALQQFNGADIRPIFYDDNNTLIGWKSGAFLKGIPLIQFFAPKWNIATGAAVTGKNVTFSFDPKYINQQLGFYKFSDDVSMDSVEGLRNIKLYQSGTQAKPVYKVKASAGCSNVDLYTQYSSVLAAAGLWVAKNKATGALITVTSVAVDANISGWTVTLDSADADYPAVGTIELSLTTPTLLKAAGVVGYESLILNIVNV